MNKFIEYTTPDDVNIKIENNEGKIQCETNDRNLNEYFYFDMLRKPCSINPIGIRNSSIYVCFYTYGKNMEIIKLKNGGVEYQDMIREDHIHIVKNKELLDNVTTFLDSGYVVYLQYVDTFDYSGFVITYVSDSFGEVYQFYDQPYFMKKDMMEFYATNALIPTLEYSKFEGLTFEKIDDKFIRRKMTYRDIYECIKMDKTKEYSSLLLRKDYCNIRRMMEASRIVSKLIIEIFDNDDKSVIRSNLLKNGFSSIVKYYRMDVSYVLKQLDNLYMSDSKNISNMILISKVKMEL